MLKWIVSRLFGFLGGDVVDGLVRGYEAKLRSATDERRLSVELAKSELEADQQAWREAQATIRAEQGRWWTALPRPLFAYIVIIYVADQVFGWGVTVSPDQLDPVVLTWMGIIVAAYFTGRSAEKVAAIIMSKIRGG